MKELGDYQTASKQFSKHMTLATECGKQVKNLKYQELAAIEQDIACMVSEDGELLERSAIIQSIINACQNPEYTYVCLPLSLPSPPLFATDLVPNLFPWFVSALCKSCV